MMPDATDTVILAMLQENARTSNAEIARTLGIAASAVLERIRKLEQRGVIQGYHAHIAPETVGRHLTAFIQVRTTSGPDYQDAMAQIAAMPEVQEVHETAGDFCLMLKVRCTTMREFGELLNSRIRTIPAVADTSTTVVIGSVKESSELPLVSD